jgi:hypothetical protein
MGAVMHMDPFNYRAYKGEYAEDEEFNGVYQYLEG